MLTERPKMHHSVPRIEKYLFHQTFPPRPPSSISFEIVGLDDHGIVAVFLEHVGVGPQFESGDNQAVQQPRPTKPKPKSFQRTNCHIRFTGFDVTRRAHPVRQFDIVEDRGLDLGAAMVHEIVVVRVHEEALVAAGHLVLLRADIEDPVHEVASEGPSDVLPLNVAIVQVHVEREDPHEHP